MLSDSGLPTFSNIKSGITIYSIFQDQNLEIINGISYSNINHQQ